MSNIASRIFVRKSNAKMHCATDIRGDDDVRVDFANRTQSGFADGVGIGATKQSMDTPSAATASVCRQGRNGNARYLSQQGDCGIRS